MKSKFTGQNWHWNNWTIYNAWHVDGVRLTAQRTVTIISCKSDTDSYTSMEWDSRRSELWRSYQGKNDTDDWIVRTSRKFFAHVARHVMTEEDREDMNSEWAEKAEATTILLFTFLLFTTVLSKWDFSYGKFGLFSLGKASCDRVTLPNLRCTLGVLVFP